MLPTREGNRDMHEFIDSPGDVLAIRLSGTITSDDLDAIMDRLDAVMAEHRSIHVYSETHAITGLQISALPHYVSRATHLFGELGRFGRVAVVGDQSWVRASSRLKSALLPGIAFLVVGPERREEAVGWVYRGEEPLPD